MKKIILILLFNLFSFFSFSQSRLGFTEYEIRKDFSNEYFYTGKTEQGLKYIYFNDQRIISMYFFDSNGVCNLCSAMPLNSGTLNYMVELYNKQYVIIDDTKWKYYTGNGGIIYISLVEVSGKLTFVYSL